MVVIVFRYKPNPAFEAEATLLGERMYSLAVNMPGFVSYKEFAAADGEVVSLVEFETHAQLEAWRDHPEHRNAQQRGRVELFTEYQIQVCDVVRTSGGR
jgi:heme-degrading monooxygenase HmoA